MFRTGHREHIFGIITLNSLDELHGNLTCEVRIFSVGFLTTAPAGIAEDIDIRCPEGQTGPPLGVTIVLRGVIVELRAAFNTNDSSFFTK